MSNTMIYWSPNSITKKSENSLKRVSFYITINECTYKSIYISQLIKITWKGQQIITIVYTKSEIHIIAIVIILHKNLKLKKKKFIWFT